MPSFQRPRHKIVSKVLKMLNANYLSEIGCYFAGGTRIVLELDEYRESMDVDFLCADQDGYRQLRGEITDQSFGRVFKADYQLLRDVRADMYGIRSYLEVDKVPIKFEIVAEGRIPLEVEHLVGLPVAVLGKRSCIAEKLLANADRGRDRSTHSRDAIDLAFMATRWPADYLDVGLAIAETVYGTAVKRELSAALEMMNDAKYRANCIEALMVSDARRLGQGLRKLRKQFDV